MSFVGKLLLEMVKDAMNAVTLTGMRVARNTRLNYLNGVNQIAYDQSRRTIERDLETVPKH